MWTVGVKDAPTQKVTAAKYMKMGEQIPVFLTSWPMWSNCIQVKEVRASGCLKSFTALSMVSSCGFRSSEVQPLVKGFFFFSTDHRGWAFWEGCPAAWPQYCGCRLRALRQCNPGGSFHRARSGSLHAGPGRYWMQWRLFLGTPWTSVFEFLFLGMIFLISLSTWFWS